MKLGAHIGISGGLPKAADRAHLVGCEVIQIFTSNPKGWNFAVRPESEIEEFKSKLDEYGIDEVYGHSIYLTNIASTNPYIHTNSINSLISGLTFAKKANIKGVITHIGSHGGQGFDIGLKQIANALEQIITSTKESVPILLETDAASGNHVGGNFKEIGEILKAVKSDALKVCFDTCHTFVSGYELRTKKGLEKTLAEFDREIGLGKLSLLHLNDSKGDFNSKLDRHEVIGEGHLGLDTFDRIVNHPKLKHLPAVIETPDTKTLADEDISLKRLKKLRKT